MTRIRRIQPWAEGRTILERPDGSYEARYGSGTLGYYASIKDAENAIQDALAAHKEAKTLKRGSKS